MRPARIKRCRGLWAGGLVALLAVALASGCDLAATSEVKPLIRLHDDQIDAQQIHNAIITVIVTAGYGYRVERVERTIKEMRRLIVAGEIDLTVELWKINNLKWYAEEIAAGTIIDFGEMYDGGGQFWMIPRWVAEQYGIVSVADMQRHWQIFQDPEDPSKGVFFNCIIGWTCRDLNEAKLHAYGLDKYYNAVSPSTPKALEAALENAQLKRVPVFGYYWNPNALMAAYDWQILTEPPYTEECWKRVVDASTGDGLPEPEVGCAYGTSPVHKIGHRGLAQKAPDLARFIGRMHMDLDTINRLLLWASRHQAGDWQQVATYFFQHYPEQWRGWVTAEAAARILQALPPPASAGPEARP
jgi:ABC-type proline/glycine betaine transport system substrate-binding protein